MSKPTEADVEEAKAIYRQMAGWVKPLDSFEATHRIWGVIAQALTKARAEGWDAGRRLRRT